MCRRLSRWKLNNTSCRLVVTGESTKPEATPILRSKTVESMTASQSSQWPLALRPSSSEMSAVSGDAGMSSGSRSMSSSGGTPSADFMRSQRSSEWERMHLRALRTQRGSGAVARSVFVSQWARWGKDQVVGSSGSVGAEGVSGGEEEVGKVWARRAKSFEEGEEASRADTSVGRSMNGRKMSSGRGVNVAGATSDGGRVGEWRPRGEFERPRRGELEGA